MKAIEMSKQEIDDINEAIASPDTKPRFSRKLLAIKMVANELKRSDICRTLDITRATLSAYVDQYLQGGIAAAMEDRSYKPTSSVDGYIDQIAQMFKESPPATANEASAMIESLCNVRLSATQVRAIMLKRLGMGFRKSGTIPGKADGQMQMDFFSNELQPRLEQAERDCRHVYFVDASHFLWGSHADYCWCFERQWVKSSSGRKRFNVLGALNAVTKKLTCCKTEGSVNAETVCSLLVDLYNAHDQGEITVVLDNVPYQHARIVREIASLLDIELLYLPPYSPNLNLIERAWKQLKKRVLSNRYYETYDCFKKAITEGIEAMNEAGEEMHRLLTLRFQMFNF